MSSKSIVSVVLSPPDLVTFTVRLVTFDLLPDFEDVWKGVKLKKNKGFDYFWATG
jgi:hypothetical protein